MSYVEHVTCSAVIRVLGFLCKPVNLTGAEHPSGTPPSRYRCWTAEGSIDTLTVWHHCRRSPSLPDLSQGGLQKVGCHLGWSTPSSYSTSDKPEIHDHHSPSVSQCSAHFLSDDQISITSSEYFQQGGTKGFGFRKQTLSHDGTCLWIMVTTPPPPPLHSSCAEEALSLCECHKL